MNGKEFGNIIDYTIKHMPEDLKGDSVGTVKEIFRNCGVEFYKGSLNEVKEVLETNDYMSWETCEAEDVKDLADNGVAVVGIKDGEIFIVAPETHLEPEEGHENIRTMSELDEDTIDGIAFFAATNTNTIERPKPIGNYLTFTSKGRVNVCTDGNGHGYDDPNYQPSTYFLDKFLDAGIHNYIVIPMNHPEKLNLTGCVGVTVRDNGKYVFGVVGDIGRKELDVVDEFSYHMVKELGFAINKNATSVTPEENVTTYIFTDTKKSAAYWKSVADFNDAAYTLGRQYFH